MKNKFLKKSAAAAMALAMSIMTVPFSAYADDDYYFNNAVSEFRSQGLKYVDRLHMSAYDRKEFDF